MSVLLRLGMRVSMAYKFSRADELRNIPERESYEHDAENWSTRFDVVTLTSRIPQT